MYSKEYLMNKKFDTIIIGAGLSGLLCGAYLSKKGQRICIIEKNSKIGGAIQVFKRKNEWFDTGMHFFGAVNEGQIQNELFKIFGINDIFEIKNVDTFKFSHKGKEYIIPIGFENYKNQLLYYFPDEKDAIEKYLAKVKEVIENITVENLMKGFKINPNHGKGIFNFINNITKNKELRDVLAFNNILYGGEKDKSSVYIHSVINGSFLQSAGMLKKGSLDFLESVKTKIESLGGEFVNSQKISKFIIENDKITSCVSENGTKFYAKNFISTLHPKLTLELTDTKLIKKFYRKRIAELPNSTSTFLMYILMKENSFKHLDTPVFFSETDDIWNLQNSYLFLTPVACKNKKYAKQVKIMSEMSFDLVKDMQKSKAHQRTEYYNKFKKQKAEEILNSIEKNFPGFKNKIDTYYTSTPLTYKDYTGTPEGSSYGIINDFNFPVRSMLPVITKVKNLFLSGQSINFHGMLGVSITAKMTCDAVLYYKE